MLVLARKIDEKIKIGDDIEITILGITGDTVRIGIEAPRHVRILRNEVYEDIVKQNKEAFRQIEIPQELQKILNSKKPGQQE
ncbi:MAG: carbon storage regulator CsrA [Peptococcaceae bacterium]|nr:carbon storage regulator CsrA [Peptococcaceae bacterium]